MFTVTESKYYSAEVREKPNGEAHLVLFELDIDVDHASTIYISLNNPYVAYNVKQVRKMAERLEAELLSNDGYANGALAVFFASYDCYGQTEYKPIAKLANNRDTDDQHRAWMLHSLMALTETAWAS